MISAKALERDRGSDPEAGIFVRPNLRFGSLGQTLVDRKTSLSLPAHQVVHNLTCLRMGCLRQCWEHYS